MKECGLENVKQSAGWPATAGAWAWSILRASPTPRTGVTVGFLGYPVAAQKQGPHVKSFQLGAVILPMISPFARKSKCGCIFCLFLFGSLLHGFFFWMGGWVCIPPVRRMAKADPVGCTAESAVLEHVNVPNVNVPNLEPEWKLSTRGVAGLASGLVGRILSP